MTAADVVPPLSLTAPEAETVGEPALTETPFDGPETLADELTEVRATGLETEAPAEAVPPPVLPVLTVADVVPTLVVVLTRALAVAAGAEPVLGPVVVIEAEPETLTGAVFAVVVTALVDEEAAVLTVPVAVDAVLETVVVTEDVAIPPSAHAPSIPVVRAPAAARIRAAETVPINRNSRASMVRVEHSRTGEVPHA